MFSQFHRRAKDKTTASVSLMGRFETEILTQSQNLKALMNQPGQWVDEIHKYKPIKEIILDMDSSDSPTFGKQEGSAYNGHFGYTCYHPLFVFNQFGDIERVLLRNGNVYSSDDWKSVLEPVVERYKDESLIRYFRGDEHLSLNEVDLEKTPMTLGPYLTMDKAAILHPLERMVSQHCGIQLTRSLRWPLMHFRFTLIHYLLIAFK
ncbi:MAG: transposase [Candidatus Bathyarchaeota archaeon]|nr:transposase [Candidatus Bathyarchaeota archaeon]